MMCGSWCGVVTLMELLGRWPHPRPGKDRSQGTLPGSAHPAPFLPGCRSAPRTRESRLVTAGALVRRMFQTAGGNRIKDLWVPRAAAALPCVRHSQKAWGRLFCPDGQGRMAPDQAASVGDQSWGLLHSWIFA